MARTATITAIRALVTWFRETGISRDRNAQELTVEDSLSAGRIIYYYATLKGVRIA